MIVLVVWIAAVVVTGLILGILGFGLFGQVSRLRRAVTTAQGDVQPRVHDLAAQTPAADLSRKASAGRHSAERQRNTAG